MSDEYDPGVTYYLCKGLSPQGGILSNGKLVWSDGDKVGDIVDGQLIDNGQVLGRIEGLTLILDYEPTHGCVEYELIPKDEFE